MIEELRAPLSYSPAGSTDSDKISGWLYVKINDDYSIDVYAEPGHDLVSANLSVPAKAELPIGDSTELIFRVFCKDRDEAEKTANGIVDFVGGPHLIGFDFDDIREIARADNHKAMLWLFESFNEEPMEAFKERIKTELPPMHALNYMLQIEGDIGTLDAYDLAQLITELSSEEANIIFSAHYYGKTPGYKVFFVFAFEGF